MKPIRWKTSARTIMQHPLTMSTSVICGTVAGASGTGLRWKKPGRVGSLKTTPSVWTSCGGSINRMTGPITP